MRRHLVLLVVVVAVLATYARTLEGTFISDDRELIWARVPALQQSSLLTPFVQPFWTDRSGPKETAYYRPLTNLSFVVDAKLHGTNAAGYHLTNVLFHALNAALLFFLLVRERVRDASAGLLTALWALQPRLADAAAWISGRTDVLATTFMLAALLSYRPGSYRRAWLAAGISFVALLCKESAIAGLLTLVVQCAVFQRSGATPKPRWSTAFLPFLTSFAVYSLVRFVVLRAAGGPEVEVAPLGQRIGTGFEALGHYGWDVLVPWFPLFEQGDLASRDLRFLVPGVVIFGMICAGGYWWWAKHPGRLPPQLPAWVLGSVSLGLVLHVLPLPSRVVATDRFLYLPTLALVWGIAPACDRLLLRPVAWVAASALLVSMAAVTFVRNGVWNSEIAFWTTAFRDFPKANAVPANELGNLYARAGLLEEALTLHRAGLAATTRGTGVERTLTSNAAMEAAQLGRFELARGYYRQLCSRDYAEECLRLARLEIREMRLGEARSVAAEVERRAPGVAGIRDVLELAAEVEALASRPELTSSDATVRAVAGFRLAARAGRRADAVALAERLSGAALAPSDRKDVLEYGVRFVDPRKLPELLARAATRGPLEPYLIDAAELRLADSSEALANWPRLGLRVD